MPTFNLIQRGNAINVLYIQGDNQWPIPLKISVPAKHFQNKGGQWIKTSYAGCDNLNNIITHRLAEIKTHVSDYFKLNKEYPVPKSLSGFFKVKKKSGNTFEECWRDFCYHQTHKEVKPVGDGRYKHYQVVYNKLVEHNYALVINEMDKEFCARFRAFLYKKGNGSNTVSSNVTIVKTFLFWCIDEDRCTLKRKDVKQFPSNWSDVDIFYHNAIELQMLIDYNTDSDSFLDAIKDDYLLQCFTGMRYGDMASKKWADEGDFLRKATQKTGEEATIPIHSLVRIILDKFKTNPYKTIDNARYNKALRELGERAKLTYDLFIVKGKRHFKSEQVVRKCDVMSSHMARATFACMMIEQDVHFQKIMEMMGITSERTLRHYAKAQKRGLMGAMLKLEANQGLRISHLQKAAV